MVSRPYAAYVLAFDVARMGAGGDERILSGRDFSLQRRPIGLGFLVNGGGFHIYQISLAETGTIL